ncbi:proteasome activator pa28 REG alpha/beta subunit [Panus rudis PR-1116 ss-1]|nr:proteasome activator pa28 REG alpha/beta subunit [Panus rudis PR-1116 ss-1]
MSGKHSTKMDKETSTKLEDFRAKAAAEADEIIFRTFPSKILCVPFIQAAGHQPFLNLTNLLTPVMCRELQQLIDDSADPSSIFNISHASKATNKTVYSISASPEEDSEPASKKRKLNGVNTTNGTVAELGVTAGNDVAHAANPGLIRFNRHMQQVHDVIKRESEQLADYCDKVKLWVNLSMPKIEDGDNFGVQIQEEVLNEVQRSQESAYNLRDAARQNHVTRAKICSKILKYPHLEDYTMALLEHDERQLYIARQNLFDIRNIYAILTDILHKNINKIRSPKGNNAVALY